MTIGRLAAHKIMAKKEIRECVRHVQTEMQSAKYVKYRIFSPLVRDCTRAIIGGGKKVCVRTGSRPNDVHE